MKLIKAITIILTLTIIALIVTAYSLDSKWQVQVSENIDSPAATIFAQINMLKRWPQWTVWNNTKYPDMHMSYEGSESGVGAIQRWQDGKDIGVLKITDSKKNQSITYKLVMGDNRFIMLGEIILDAAPDNTKVTWRLTGDNGEDLIARLMMVILKPMIEKDLSTGLTNLKSLMEKPH